MNSCQIYNSWFYLLCFLLVSGIATSSSFVSNGALNQDHGVVSRNLLEEKRECDVNFAEKNYSVFESNCKGPPYPEKECCNALKQFACPFADKINDVETNCAILMFGFINFYGNKYPTGLFDEKCKEGKEGLDCSTVKLDDSSSIQKPKSPDSSSVQTASNRSSFIVFSGCVLANFLRIL